jgi:hypothetical protein
MWVAKGPKGRRQKSCANQGGSDVISPDILHLLSSLTSRPAHRTYLRIHQLHRNLRTSLVACLTVRKIATPLKNGLPHCHDPETGCILRQPANAALWEPSASGWLFEAGMPDLQAA